MDLLVVYTTYTSPNKATSFFISVGDQSRNRGQGEAAATPHIMAMKCTYQRTQYIAVFEYGTTCNLLVLYYDIPGLRSTFLENFNVNFEEAESTFINEFHFLCRICIFERLMKSEEFRRMKELDILDIFNSIGCLCHYLMIVFPFL